MLVSVIICFKNEKRFLYEAISSVVHQSYPNWELILVDDGSSDTSTQIAQDIVSANPSKIKYVHHPHHLNKGLSASRNLGISESKGEMICFLDADDVLLPTKIETQLKIFQEHPDADVICESTEYWYDWENPDKPNQVVHVGVAAGFIYQPAKLLFSLYPLGKGNAPCIHSMMIRKTVFETIGGFDPSFTGMYEDQVFLTKVYLNIRVFISNECNNKYRIREDSMSQQALHSGRYYFYRKAYLAWVVQYAKVHHHRVESLDKKIAAAAKEIQPWRIFTRKFLDKFRFEKQ